MGIYILFCVNYCFTKGRLVSDVPKIDREAVNVAGGPVPIRDSVMIYKLLVELYRMLFVGD